MIIAVDSRRLADGRLEEEAYVTKEVLLLLMAQYPQHQFHLIFDKQYSKLSISSDNITLHVVSPPAGHPLFWKYWFDVKVPLLLRRIKADVFFSPNGQCSLTTKVPQCMVLHHLGYLHHPDMYKKSHQLYLKKYTPAFIRKAKEIITPSHFLRQELIRHYQTGSEKISVVYCGVKDVFRPAGFDEQTCLKEKYTGGTEFFIYAGAIQPHKNLVNLLRAFSVFKKRLQSSMKLVLAGRMSWKNDEFSQLLSTYKYKDDVVLTGHLEEEELSRLMASAYACVNPYFEGAATPLAAMRCGVPVLTSAHPAMEEVEEGAALYFNPDNMDDMADKLMLVYKDERGRRELIEKGRLVAAKYTAQQTTDAVWDCLVRTAAHL